MFIHDSPPGAIRGCHRNSGTENHGADLLGYTDGAKLAAGLENIEADRWKPWMLAIQRNDVSLFEGNVTALRSQQPGLRRSVTSHRFGQAIVCPPGSMFVHVARDPASGSQKEIDQEGWNLQLAGMAVEASVTVEHS